MEQGTYRCTTFAKTRSKELRKQMTRSERHLWYDFLRDHKPRFQRQRPIGPYIVDFICYDAALIIELDGEAHDAAEKQEHDEARDNYLKRHGLRTIRFRSQDVFENFEGVCKGIELAMKDPTMEGYMT
ncbi:endonuclease domain-containing protein [Selenomonas sp.]|uniref:endonuclease domain-containing protein n=1 Tax=Selenomonas sp. TaxID=2053611 RepID=UPI00260150AC|nr:endonuclease domain-containing protein [Selenomonas sp.]MCI6087048.1 endonuclease domain-containing protein [Selenomonas sp.]MDY3298743.1 endonuclease domain-containing protein [Selenomonas sp.]MDY4416389.1 endonuclease domain-containing protein [Selenomonas sp.]